jgi:hypothetical protein
MKKTALDTLSKAGIMLLVIAFLFLITWFLYYKFSASPLVLDQKSSENNSSLNIFSDKKEFKIGEELEAEIILENAPSDLTSFALRVFCSWNEKTSPIAALTDGKVLKVGPDLETNGWIFPVLQVKPLENSWQIDLAGVNLSGEDLKNNSLVLGIFKFQTKSSSSSLNCRLDPSLTKILTRSAGDFAVDLNGFSFVILN